MPYHKERHSKRASLHTEAHEEDDEDEDAVEDAKFFNVNIDSLIGPEVVFDFEPQTEFIVPVTWDFTAVLIPRASNWDESFPHQCPDSSSVRWTFDQQLIDQESHIKWKFSKVTGTNGIVRWEFPEQCPETTTVRWRFPHCIADTGKIKWQFPGQVNAIVPLNWGFANQISEQPSTVNWYFIPQCPNLGSVPWKFEKQSRNTMQGKWKFIKQLVDDKVVPWRFVSQLVISRPVNWNFLNQLELDRHVNWGFEKQSGVLSVPWRFQPCLNKDIYGAQLSWNFEHCIGDSQPVKWDFLSMISGMAPVNWENLPSMTATLCADVPQTYEEIAEENTTFKKKYSRGYVSHQHRKKHSVH